MIKKQNKLKSYFIYRKDEFETKESVTLFLNILVIRMNVHRGTWVASLVLTFPVLHY